MGDELESKYQELLDECKNSPDIVGLILLGATGKDRAFLTKHSDIDVRVIVSDSAPLQLIEHETTPFLRRTYC